MAKFTTFVMLMSGLTLLFYFTGLIGQNPLLDLLFNPENMTTLAFYSTLLTAIGTSAAAIFIGFVTKNIELAAATLFTPIILALLWNFIQVFNKISAVNRVVGILILAPTLFMFIITIYDWWRGRTT